MKSYSFQNIDSIFKDVLQEEAATFLFTMISYFIQKVGSGELKKVVDLLYLFIKAEVSDSGKDLFQSFLDIFSDTQKMIYFLMMGDKNLLNVQEESKLKYRLNLIFE